MEINIVVQGAPVVNGGVVFANGDGVVAISVDMGSKYCEVSATTGGPLPGIMVGANERSLSLDTSKPREADTFIEFPEYAGWRVWCADIGRYTLAVCLVKEEG